VSYRVLYRQSQLSLDNDFNGVVTDLRGYKFSCNGVEAGGPENIFPAGSTTPPTLLGYHFMD